MTEEEYMRRKLEEELPGRMEGAGYPLRAIKTLPTMHGPGLAAVQSLKLNDGAILMLLGDRGPGKTQMAVWLAAQRILAGKSCGAYRKWLDLQQEIRATWRDGANDSEAEVLARYAKKPLLVIDEVQERGSTEADIAWCDRTLTHLVDRRYDAMLATVMIANLTVKRYEETIPLSIRSRVSETGGIKVCDWPSYRH